MTYSKSRGSHVFQDALDVKKLICQGSKRENGLSGSARLLLHLLWKHLPSKVMRAPQPPDVLTPAELCATGTQADVIRSRNIKSHVMVNLRLRLLYIPLHPLPAWILVYLSGRLHIIFPWCKIQRGQIREKWENNNQPISHPIPGWHCSGATSRKLWLCQQFAIENGHWVRWLSHYKNGGSFHSLSYMC